jgi:hypothetical protein
MRSFLKRCMVVALPLVALTAVPITYSADEGLTEGTACAQSGTCCAESGSTCVIGSYIREGAYYKSEGSCWPIIR